MMKHDLKAVRFSLGIRVIAQQMHANFQREDHDHHRQRVDDEVHFAAAPFQNRDRQLRREDRQSQNHPGQTPVAKLEIQQAKTDHHRDENVLLVRFATTQAIEFVDHNRCAGDVDRMPFELAVLQDVANRSDRGRAIFDAVIGERHDHTDSFSRGRDKQSAQPLIDVRVGHGQLAHHGSHALRGPTVTDSGRAFDASGDALDQVVAETLIQSDENDFFRAEAELEIVVLTANHGMFWEPRFDVVVRRNRLGVIMHQRKDG